MHRITRGGAWIAEKYSGSPDHIPVGASKLMRRSAGNTYRHRGADATVVRRNTIMAPIGGDFPRLPRGWGVEQCLPSRTSSHGFTPHADTKARPPPHTPALSARSALFATAMPAQPLMKHACLRIVSKCSLFQKRRRLPAQCRRNIDSERTGHTYICACI